MADPKDENRAGTDPKDENRAGTDPKDENRAGGLGGDGQSPPVASGAGVGGWGLVAFIGPVGLNVPELALRSLRGESAPRPARSSRRAQAISDLYQVATNEARKELRVQASKDAELKWLKSKAPNGKP